MPTPDPTTLLPQVVLVLAYLPLAMRMSWWDAREHRLPNPLVGALTALTLLGLGLSALLEPELRSPLRVALVLAAVVGAGAVLLALLAPPLLGMGDAKTLPAVVLMTSMLGGGAVVAGACGALLLAGIAGAVTLVRTGTGRARFALGPVLLSTPFLGLLGAPLLGPALGG